MATVMRPFGVTSQADGAAPGRSRKANVLLVDDRAENLVALEAVLKPLKQNLILARSGEEALKCLLKHDVAVILLDVMMPGLDGFETAAYVKQLQRTRHIPIIFLTAISKDKMHVFQGYSVGAVDYVIKPFDPAVLRSKVAAFVELHDKTLALHESEERFRRAFANAPIGVALVDMEGRLVKVNRALCEMTGHAEPHLIGLELSDLCHPDHASWDFVRMATEFAEDKRSYHGERILRAANGEDVHALISASFVPNIRDDSPYFIFQLTDITERKKLETLRDRFVVNAAHELRTPIGVILGTTTLLSKSRGELSEPEMDACLEALHRQSSRLSIMVSTLLDLARLEEGRLDLIMKPVSLTEVIEHAIKETEAPDGRSVEAQMTPEVIVRGDAAVLDRILSNLLMNAYRYGGPNVTIEALREEAIAYLSVIDDGDGVPQDLVPHLFDPFTRGRTASRVGGSGLGLSLARGLAQALGGDVYYVPHEPKGARFTVILKAADEQP
jgi:PAS domain S-box-containing protein